MMKDQISAQPVIAPSHRMTFLPHMFSARHMLKGEALLYHFARKLSADYTGGLWDFYRLSEGGYYAAPAHPARMTISVDGNGYSGDVSADAAGIVFSLFTLGAMASRAAERNDDDGLVLFSMRYHQLLDYAHGHAERAAIMSAID